MSTYLIPCVPLTSSQSQILPLKRFGPWLSTSVPANYTDCGKAMKRALPPPQERVQIDFDLITVKELLRDLLFREAGQAYFKRLAVPRQHRWLGAWRTLSTYQVEKQLLPVGGRDTNRLIQQFFTTYACLRAEFRDGGMPVTAIR